MCIDDPKLASVCIKRHKNKQVRLNFDRVFNPTMQSAVISACNLRQTCSRGILLCRHRDSEILCVFSCFAPQTGTQHCSCHPHPPMRILASWSLCSGSQGVRGGPGQRAETARLGPLGPAGCGRSPGKPLGQAAAPRPGGWRWGGLAPRPVPSTGATGAGRGSFLSALRCGLG